MIPIDDYVTELVHEDFITRGYKLGKFDSYIFIWELLL